MAYARWSDGPWYIYWAVGSGKTRETQALFVGLANGTEAYIDPAEAEAMLVSDIWPRWPNISPEVREDARESLREWLSEVDESPNLPPWD